MQPCTHLGSRIAGDNSPVSRGVAQVVPDCAGVVGQLAAGASQEFVMRVSDGSRHPGREIRAGKLCVELPRAVLSVYEHQASGSVVRLTAGKADRSVRRRSRRWRYQ